MDAVRTWEGGFLLKIRRGLSPFLVRRFLCNKKEVRSCVFFLASSERRLLACLLFVGKRGREAVATRTVGGWWSTERTIEQFVYVSCAVPGTE